MDTETTLLTEIELAYLHTQRLGRLATVDADGAPQNNPVGFAIEPGGRIVISGYAMGTTRKFRNARDRPAVALVVDDVAAVDPWTVRGVEIRGTAEALTDVDPPMEGLSREQLRITPHWVAHWGLDDGGFTRRGQSPGPPPEVGVEALLAEYFRRFDTRPDGDAWLTGLADDDVDVRFPVGSGRGRAALDALSRDGWGRWAATMHRVEDVGVDADGGFTATLHALHVHHDDDPGRPMLLEAGIAGAVAGDPARLTALSIAPRHVTGDGPGPR